MDSDGIDAEKLQRKYSKLKKVYIALKKKYIENQLCQRREAGLKESVEIVSVKAEEALPPFINSNGVTISKLQRLTNIAPKRQHSPKQNASPLVKPSTKPTISVGLLQTQKTASLEDLKHKNSNRRKSNITQKKVENIDFNINNNEEDRIDEKVLISPGESLSNSKMTEKKKIKRCRKKIKTELNKEQKRWSSDMEKKQQGKKARKNTKEPEIIRCDACGKFLSTKTILKKHKRIHTGERPYQCELCGKSFNSRSSLVGHTRLHNGIKPFKCHHCDKLFPETSQRTTHERIHTGEKPYMCDLCGSCFSLRSSLVRHRRIHTGEKPYVCSECGAAYCQYNQLTNHKKKCAPGQPTLVPLRIASHNYVQCDVEIRRPDDASSSSNVSPVSPAKLNNFGYPASNSQLQNPSESGFPRILEKS